MPTDYAPPTYDEIRTALSYIPTPSSYADWYPMAFAIKDALGENGKDLWHDWSRQGDNYNARVAEATWKSARPKAGGITVATLFKQARDNGYRPDKPAVELRLIRCIIKLLPNSRIPFGAIQPNPPLPI